MLRYSMSEWVGIISAMIGGILALLGVSLQSRRQAHHDKRKLLLAKLEELYSALSLLRKSYKAADLEAVSHITGSELASEVKNALPVPIEKLQMLVGIYAPELTAHLERVEKARDAYGYLYGQYILVPDKRGEAGKTAISALFSQQSEIQQACVEMQAAVASLARKYI